MRILNRYIATDYLVTFVMTVLVFTFVMSVGTIVKAIDLMSRGISIAVVGEVFVLSIPFILQFTVPISALTATLLLFSRLSMDGEITALRACGLSLWQIVSPVVLLSVLLSIITMTFSLEIAPRARYAQRFSLRKFSDEDPVALLEEGRFVRDFPGFMIYVGAKNGSEVKDVILYETAGDSVKSNIRARSGTIRADRERKLLLVDLYDVRMQNMQDGAAAGTYAEMHREFGLETFFKTGSVTKKFSDYTIGELVSAIRSLKTSFPGLDPKDLLKQRMRMLVEAHSRMALAMACFAFGLLGIPLGMKSRRKESSVGVAISLGMVFVFYFFIILAQSLAKSPQFHPDLIVWIPIFLAQAVGFILIGRMQ